MLCIITARMKNGSVSTWRVNVLLLAKSRSYVYMNLFHGVVLC